ncbi:MAG: hypothetical protein RML95_13165 [Anaerolineae bacterium]|nr:hypothetical protein [Anaerolineae bacterium]MDW8300276.1 hypothetical protein [Anaerolineae bacterium]
MAAILFITLVFAPALLMIGVLARRRRLGSMLSALPALSVLLYALPYEGVIIAARFWQVSAAAASGIIVLGVPLERLILDGMAIFLASVMAHWLWRVHSARQ